MSCYFRLPPAPCQSAVDIPPRLAVSAPPVPPYVRGHSYSFPGARGGDQAGIEQPQPRTLGGETGNDLGPAPALAKHPLQQVGSADSLPVSLWELQIGQPVWNNNLEARLGRCHNKESDYLGEINFATWDFSKTLINRFSHMGFFDSIML